MFRQIILALLAFTVIALLIMWVIGGGPRRTINQIQDIDVLPFSPAGETGFRLPWQPAQLFPTLNITDALLIAGDDSIDPEYQLSLLEQEYDRLNSASADVRSFGNPSPLTGSVSIVGDASGVRSESAQEEYLQIAANSKNSTSIDITGWSLESALSGTRIYLPPGASTFLMGVTNTIGALALDPGGLAIVSSAASPVGISFRENSCSGYLEQFQPFAPQLDSGCPSPSSILPLTEENLQRYGEPCFDVVNALRSCEFPQNLPETVYSSCRAYLTEKLSYNGCVDRERSRFSFKKNMWRVYLGSSNELWRNSHDAIRLLDAQGKTVDVFVY